MLSIVRQSVIIPIKKELKNQNNQTVFVHIAEKKFINLQVDYKFLNMVFIFVTAPVKKKHKDLIVIILY